MSEIVHPTAVVVPEHSHELAYFTLILGGAYAERFGPHTHEHRAMSILWHRAGISHKDQIGRHGARCFTVEVNREAMKSLGEYTTEPLDLSERGTTLVSLASRLFYEFKNWNDGSELIAQGLTLEMLGRVAISSNERMLTRPAWLSGVVEKLRAEYLDGFSMELLAAGAGIHPIHLAFVFRRFYGQTIGEYVQQLRVNQASRLLVEGRALADVAYETGFATKATLTAPSNAASGSRPVHFELHCNEAEAPRPVV